MIARSARRRPALPVIVVSAREESEQKVAALDLGADDYVTKPFDTERAAGAGASVATPQARVAGGAGQSSRPATSASTCSAAWCAAADDGDPPDARRNMHVLAELAKHPGRVLTHAQLLRAAWGPAQERQTEYLRVVMRALRQKLEAIPAEPRLILNEPGVGYRLMSI